MSILKCHVQGSLPVNQNTNRSCTLQPLSGYGEAITLHFVGEAAHLIAPFLESPEWRGKAIDWTLLYSGPTSSTYSALNNIQNVTGREVELGRINGADRWLAAYTGHSFNFIWSCTAVPAVPPVDLPACDVFSRHDIALIFPDEEGKQNCLWANKIVMKEGSPYWKRLFEAGYAESEQYLEGMSAWKEILAKDISKIVDSAGSSSVSAAEGLSTAKEAGIQYIVVRDAPLQTYRAILVWLESKHISFPQTASSAESGAEPTSAKAIYALAHKLEIGQLQRLALADYVEKLDSSNSMAELFSVHALLYPDIKEAAMKAVITNWSAIKASGGTSYVQEVVKVGERNVEQVAEIVGELLGKLNA